MTMSIGSIADDLQACAWAYLGITKNAEAIAQLPPVVQTYQNGQWVKSESHPLNQLIRAPLGSTTQPPNWSWGDWLKVAAIHLQMSDIGFVARIAAGLSLPLDCVTQTFGAIGRKGAGKTYLATMMAEQMLAT